MQSVQHMVRTGRRGPMLEFSMAFPDLRASTERIGLAWSLAWHDVVSRYRGSILGPFWITLSMGLMVAGIGLLYANLFNVPLNEFMPYVALGIVFWGMIGNVIIEGCDTFVQASGMLSPDHPADADLRLAHGVAEPDQPGAPPGDRRRGAGVLRLLAPRPTCPLALVGVAAGAAQRPAGSACWSASPRPATATSRRSSPRSMQFAMFMTPVFWMPGRFARPTTRSWPSTRSTTCSQAVRAPLLGQPVASRTYVVLVGDGGGRLGRRPSPSSPARAGGSCTTYDRRPQSSVHRPDAALPGLRGRRQVAEDGTWRASPWAASWAAHARASTEVTALTNVNLELKAGDRLGLIGHNGSGKTTLLRALAGAYEPDEGTIEVHGRIAAMLDLNLGIDPSATGLRQHPPARPDRRPERPRRSRRGWTRSPSSPGLGPFLAMPVKTYSAGMQGRLAFAAATAVEADVLLMDEWIAVGDADFQKLAHKRLLKLVERAGILVLASHDVELIRALLQQGHADRGRRRLRRSWTSRKLDELLTAA